MDFSNSSLHPENLKSEAERITFPIIDVLNLFGSNAHRGRYRVRRKKLIIFINSLLTVLFLLTVSAFAGYPGVEEHVIKAVERVEPAVVNIKTIYMGNDGEYHDGLGSGVIISAEGWILTNAHVTRNARKIFISLTDGRKYAAAVWRAYPNEDIAVIKINAKKLPVAPIGDSGSLKKGQVAIAIGNPWSFASTVTVGCISAIERSLETRKIVLKDMIQTDAAINPGNSGGPLVTSKGEVIGINTVVYTGTKDSYVTGLGFAIPINRALKLGRELIRMKEKGKQRPRLGINGADVTPALGLHLKSGVIITSFPPDSPSRKAGLRVGDIIISLNQVPVGNVQDLKKVLFRYSPGDTITIVVARGKKKLRGRVRLEGMRQ